MPPQEGKIDFLLASMDVTRIFLCEERVGAWVVRIDEEVHAWRGVLVAYRNLRWIGWVSERLVWLWIFGS
jgi:hypothetical protein